MPAGNSPSENLPDTTDSATPERPGTLVGRYKLRELIGEGGMGTVWIAEQTEPVRRKVALKLIKPGMDTKEVLSRFQVERQALALMDHPNIAKVHDGGVTAAGRPFFVMEYVKGIPITQYCDEARLTVKQRLELFVDVCQAVQHAHQKGIIHRDLKPSNILVCLYDGKPIPKIIDFGLAKAMHQPLTENTLYTAHGLMVGTPQYMSPEQAEFNNLDVDTRTDVYSLGVILYELLTGTTPLERKQVKEAAVQEILRLIKEEDPPKPSTKISTSGALPHIAAQRNLEPAQLSRLVRGDLDWIAMKSLEKDRSRRYETANGLARDIQRYLADEPVEACPPSLKYKLRKLAVRNKRALATFAMLSFVVLTAMAVVAGSVGWVVRDRLNRKALIGRQIQVALDEVAQAVKENRLPDADAALKQAEGLLASSETQQPQDSDVRRWRADLKIAQRLRTIQLDGGTYDSDVVGRAAYVAAYRRAFEDYGVRIDGDPAKAAERIRESPIRLHLLAALDDWLFEVDWGPHPIGDGGLAPPIRAVLAQADKDPWRAAFRDAARTKNLAQLKQLAEGTGWQDQLPLTTVLLGVSLMNCKAVDTAYQMLARAHERHPTDFGIQSALGMACLPDLPWEAVRHLQSCRNQSPSNPGVRLALAESQLLFEEPLEAEKECREAIRLRPDYAAAHGLLGRIMQSRNLPEESIAAYRVAARLDPSSKHCFDLLHLLMDEQKFELAEEVFRDLTRRHPQSVSAHTCLGSTLLRLEKWGDAEQASREALRLSRHSQRARCDLAKALERQGKYAEAETTYQEAMAQFPNSVTPLVQYAEYLQERQRWTEAEAIISKGLQIEPRDPGVLAAQDAIRYALQMSESPDNAEILARRGLTLLRRKDPNAAAELIRATQLPAPVIATVRDLLADSGNCWFDVGMALSELHSKPHAEIALRRALDLLEKLQREGTDEPETLVDRLATLRVYLGNSVWTTADPQAANEHFRSALKLNPDTAMEAHVRLGRLHLSAGRWDDAAPHLAIFIANRPQQHLLAMQTAVLHLYRSDRAGYERICQTMLKHYAATNDATEADRTAKACLLASPPAGDMEQLKRLAEIVVTAPQDKYRQYIHYFPLVGALAAYRQGEWHETLRWCGTGLDRLGPSRSVPDLAAHYLVVQAMAEQHLGDHEKVHSHLAEAAQLIQSRFPDAPNNLGLIWADWQLYEVLRREAEQLIPSVDKVSP